MLQNWRLLALPASRLGCGQRNAIDKSKGRVCERHSLGRRVSSPDGGGSEAALAGLPSDSYGWEDVATVAGNRIDPVQLRFA